MTIRPPAMLRLAALCTVLLAGAAPAGHPSLLLTPQGVAELKQRIASAPFAKAQYDAMKTRVDGELGKAVELPPRGQNWYHWYVCPKHGSRLRVGKSIGRYQWEHVCPIDREVFKGDPSDVKTDFDGCALSGEHARWGHLVREAGLMYQLTGERKYADKARDVLVAYANKYEQYPLHTIRNEPKVGGGKIGSQTLDESTWAIAPVQGADLVWDVIPPADRELIAKKLFQPLAREVILKHRMGVHNIQCWKNSAVGLVGFLLDDKELIAEAIDDPKQGFKVQMAKGVVGDGLWWEGAWGYHFYTVSALMPLVEAAKNNGQDLWKDPNLKKLYDAPLAMAMPDMVLPDFNDSGKVNLAGLTNTYELAYARWQDPRYLAILAGSRREDPNAFLYGVPKLPPPPRAELNSANFPETGYGILVAPPSAAGSIARNATWLCLDYGPHGGGHGHPDKLSFVLYARGRVIVPDGGITSYGTPLHAGWYHATPSHSTLVVDQAEQKPATGKCLAFGSAGGVQYVVAEAGEIYKGVRFARTAMLLDADTLVFVDHVSADKERTLDLFYHERGRLADDRGQPWTPPEKVGYKYLKDGKAAPLAAGHVVAITGEKGEPMPLALAASGPAEVITATGPGANTADRVPAIIVRQTAREACVAWAVTLAGDAKTIKLRPATGADGKALAMSEAAWVEVGGRAILSNPGKRAVKGAGTAAAVVEGAGK